MAARPAGARRPVDGAVRESPRPWRCPSGRAGLSRTGVDRRSGIRVATPRSSIMPNAIRLLSALVNTHDRVSGIHTSYQGLRLVPGTTRRRSTDFGSAALTRQHVQTRMKMSQIRLTVQLYTNHPHKRHGSPGGPLDRLPYLNRKPETDSYLTFPAPSRLRIATNVLHPTT